MKKQRTLESWMMVNGKAGQVFYSEKKDKHLTALSVHYERKIITERLIAVTTGKEVPSASNLTKVTLL